MKTFKQRVINLLRLQDWNIQYTDIPFIDFFSIRPHTHARKAYRTKAHRHLSQKEQKELYDYGKRTGIHVIYIHETAGHELEFIRLYPRTLKAEAI